MCMLSALSSYTLHTAGAHDFTSHILFPCPSKGIARQIEVCVLSQDQRHAIHAQVTFVAGTEAAAEVGVGVGAWGARWGEGWGPSLAAERSLTHCPVVQHPAFEGNELAQD